MANIKDIAKHTGLSIATISRVFNDSPLVKPQTKQLVLKAAEALDYQHNISAAALRNGKSKIIGVVVPDIDNGFFATVVNSIENRLKESGYSIIIAQSHESPELENEALSILQRLNVDGVLISTSKGTQDFQPILKMINHNIPFVFFDRIPVLGQIDSVALDDYTGAKMATQHLIDVGCRHIIHAQGDARVSIFRNRRKGFEDTMLEAGLEVNRDKIIELNADKVEFGTNESANKLLIQQTFKEYPTIDGIFAYSDIPALYILDILKEMNISVPEQVKIIGFGNFDFTVHVTPSLSSVCQSCDQMGFLAAEKLIGQIQSTEPICSPELLPPRLMIRASSQPH